MSLRSKRMWCSEQKDLKFSHSPLKASFLNSRTTDVGWNFSLSMAYKSKALKYLRKSLKSSIWVLLSICSKLAPSQQMSLQQYLNTWLSRRISTSLLREQSSAKCSIIRLTLYPLCWTSTRIIGLSCYSIYIINFYYYDSPACSCSTKHSSCSPLFSFVIYAFSPYYQSALRGYQYRNQLFVYFCPLSFEPSTKCLHYQTSCSNQVVAIERQSVVILMPFCFRKAFA